VSWTVILSPSSQRDLTRLDRPVAARILDALTRFGETGHGDIERVRGTTGEVRLRVGDWRVRFRYLTATRTMEVLRVLPRGEAYR